MTTTPAQAPVAAAGTPSLADRHVVVIGGTSGIGLATAHAAAAHGAAITVVSARESSVSRALAELPEGARGHTVNVLDQAALGELFDRIGPFDHLVYTAGEALRLLPIDGLELDAVRDFLQTRYLGALATVAAAAGHLRAGGSITLTGGSAGVRPGPGWAVPASLCGAMEALTRALAVELAPVRVNLVRPGLVRSSLWSDLDEDARAELYREGTEQTLVGHVGEVAEIAQAYLYCMTQTYATGAVIAVDGGSVLV
ncbi:SDR family oxidoreductase [Kitasatospora sp. NPDC052896]|uniref:SDR family oxidoreductase n=1 Tax=Kitasatospora sp. NPDC052896 TaxID=3364061 RepID=UPI0037CC7374